MYRAAKASWPLAFYKRLDKLFSAFYRKIFHLPRTFPEALLYMDVRYAALGLRRFSDEAQLQKWGMVHRLLATGGESATAANQLLLRAQQAFRGRITKRTCSFLTSVMQWGSVNKISLEQAAQHGMGTQSSLASISSFLRPSPGSQVDQIFTDGSVVYSGLTVSDALTNPWEIDDKACGAFAVVVVSKDLSSGDTQTKAVRIPVTTQSMTTVSPYITELLGQMVAASCCDLSHSDVQVYCDCSGVVAGIRRSIGDQRTSAGQLAHPFLYESLARLDLQGRFRTKWVRSHPERHKGLLAIESWTAQDVGIYTADAVAGGDLQTLVDIGYPVDGFLDITDPLVIEGIIHPKVWLWREVGPRHRLLTTSLRQHVQAESLRLYCSARDSFRRKVGLPPKWEGTFPCKMRKSLPLWERKRQCLRAWDKSFTNGCNRAKSAHEAPNCNQCGHPDSIYHMCLQCEHRDIRTLREQAFDQQQTLLDKLIASCPSWKASLFRLLRRMTWAQGFQCNEAIEHLWRGIIPADITDYIPLEILTTGLASMSDIHELQKEYSSLLRPLTDATQAMLTTRGRLFFETEGVILRQRAEAVRRDSLPPPPVMASGAILRMPGFRILRRAEVRSGAFPPPSVQPNRIFRQTRLSGSSRTPLESRTNAPVNSVRIMTVQDLIESGWSSAAGIGPGLTSIPGRVPDAAPSPVGISP